MKDRKALEVGSRSETKGVKETHPVSLRSTPLSRGELHKLSVR